MNRGIRCVVFDFDGTLVDSNAIKRETYFEILRDVEGSASAVEEVLRAEPTADRHGTLAAVHARLAAGGASGLPGVREWVDAYSAKSEQLVIACPPLVGALSALDALTSGFPLYIASATPEDALLRVVEGRGWSERFAGIYGGPRSKRENLLRVARREDIAAGQIVYVGDAAVDRLAAQAFGCAFVGAGASGGALPDPALTPLEPLLREIARRASAG